MTTVAVSSDEAVETEYDSDTFDDESIEEQFSKRNIEAVAPQTKVLSDNSNVDSEECTSYESEDDEVYEFSEDEFEEEEDNVEKHRKNLDDLKKQLSYDDLDEIDKLVVSQTQMVNEKVKKRLELVTPPKKLQSEKPLESPTDNKSKTEQKTLNPLKEVENFNIQFLQESDKLRAKAETTQEVENKAKEEVKSKPFIKERKMQIKTVAQVHKDGNELEKNKDETDLLETKDTNLSDEEQEKEANEAELEAVTKVEESQPTKCTKCEKSKPIPEKEPEPKIITERMDSKIKSSGVDDDSNDGDEDDDDDDDDDVVIVESDSSSDDGLDMEMRSHTPSSMRSSDYAYHLNFERGHHQSGCPAHLGNCKPPTRKNMSFTNPRLREIERHNEILLKKILSQKPSYLAPMNKPRKPDNPISVRKSSAEINRKKQQRQIDLDNLVLKKKIEAISRRPTKS